MLKLTVIHFQPLEGYPPVLNLLSFLALKPELKVLCLSTKGSFGYDYENKTLSIKRLSKVGVGLHPLHRALTYILFNLGSLFWLVAKQPEVILYFESISGWATCIYKKYFNKDVRLLIHYHEYASPVEYSQGMVLVRYIHNLEKNIYSKAEWISHTNHFRLGKFRKDEKLESLPESIFKIMPNYPPLNWKKAGNLEKPQGKVRLVYVGYSLSFDTMYTREILDWVKVRHDRVEIDIYLHKIPDSMRNYLTEQQIKNVRLLPSIKYEELPRQLPDYDIGLIIYNGAIENYVYNAPNKLFEYLSCGLDVWLPSVMTGSLEYVCPDAHPRVLALDFEKLTSYSEDYLFGAFITATREVNYYCEPVYEVLYQHMIGEK